MKTSLFEDCTLLISARSPFARRIRLAFRENGVRYVEAVHDVFKPGPELLKTNPLRRVPAVLLKSGEVIVDSNSILSVFYEQGAPSRTRWLRGLASARASAEAAHWSGMAVGLCERLVEYFLETQRPEAARDQEILAEIIPIADGFFEALERHLSDGRARILVAGDGQGEELNQADLDLGTALAYTSLRYSPEWILRYPAARRYFEALNARPSFVETRPPAPVTA